MPAVPITTTCQSTAIPAPRRAGLRMATGCQANTDTTNQTAFRGIIERDPAADTKNPAAGKPVDNISKIKVSTPLTDRNGSPDKLPNTTYTN